MKTQCDNHKYSATAKMYPIYGTQWHPEKNVFEWAPDQAINGTHGNHHLPATAKMYPIYGTQWHPEKNVFEWTTKEGINHSAHAVMIAQRAANFCR